jgi:uncharacterized protein
MTIQNGIRPVGVSSEVTAAAAPPVVTYRFGAFLLDMRRRLLFFGSEIRPLPEKLFQILIVLLEAGGETVRKEDFFSSVWPGDDISDANLTQHIFMLRGLLGESARDHSYVVTVAGKGYRMAMPIEQKSGLTMKQVCERCQRILTSESSAEICSYECTFCIDCAETVNHSCPNCLGELRPRPRRPARKA